MIREARDDERHLRKSRLQVSQVVIFGCGCAHISCPALEEVETLLLPALDAVKADVIDLPAHTGVLEEVEDAEVVDDPIAKDTVGRQASCRAGGEVQAIWICRTEDRAEVVDAES